MVLMPRGNSIVIAVAVTASAGIGRIALRGAGWCRHGRRVGTSLGHRMLGARANTAVRAVTVGGPGRNTMPQRIGLGIGVSMTAIAGVQGVAFVGTRGLNDGLRVAVDVTISFFGKCLLLALSAYRTGTLQNAFRIFGRLFCYRSCIPIVFGFIADRVGMIAGSRVPVIHVVGTPFVLINVFVNMARTKNEWQSNEQTQNASKHQTSSFHHVSPFLSKKLRDCGKRSKHIKNLCLSNLIIYLKFGFVNTLFYFIYFWTLRRQIAFQNKKEDSPSRWKKNPL